MAVMGEATGGRTFPRLDWSAVIAGVFLAVAAHIVMGLVGAALGFAAEPADSQAAGAAAAIWALITPFVATLLGAWLACRMAGAHDDKRAANVHGILVWCIGLIAGALFLTGTLATGAMTAGTAASGNLGPAQRMMPGDAGAPPAGEARADGAAKAAAAAAGGAALAAIAGLLGAVVGAGISGRRTTAGKGLGWRIALQRTDEARATRLAGEERGYGGTSTPYGAAPPRMPGGATEGSPERPPPVDPYHH
jgi:hypothetical protein